jgi:hypothetical protein
VTSHLTTVFSNGRTKKLKLTINKVRNLRVYKRDHKKKTKKNLTLPQKHLKRKRKKRKLQLMLFRELKSPKKRKEKRKVK